MTDSSRASLCLGYSTIVALGRYGASVPRVALLSRGIKAAVHRSPFVEVGRLTLSRADVTNETEWIREEEWANLKVMFVREVAKIVGDALRTDWAIRSLVLSRTILKETDAKIIGDALRNNSKLRSLDMSYNYVGDEGAKAIADALRNNSTLRSLYLSGNYVQDEGVKAIGCALRN
eukprot:Selendium_serpulae@DN9061_c0_g1_i1.p1